MTTTPQQNLMAKFAFISYVGEQLSASQPAISKYESELLELALKNTGLSDWEVVWGPMLYRFPAAPSGLYDNFMFVARNGTQYVIAVRGTNGHAGLDWLLEDFWVTSQFPWNKLVNRQMPAGMDPKISSATHLGIEKLLTTPVVAGLPGGGTNIIQFLSNEIAGKSDVTVNVTGHSLGGALAPTLALFLKDTQGPGGWDPQTNADIWSYALAGATAGNGDFARYTEDRMGLQAIRIVNPLDIVPMAWWQGGLDAMSHVYDQIENPVDMTLGEKVALDAVKEIIKLGGFDYEQYHTSGPGLVLLESLTGHSAATFLDQAGWQHSTGYQNQMGLENLQGELSAVFQQWCQNQAPGTCPESVTGGIVQTVN